MSASLWDDLPLASADGLLSTEECFMLLDADFFDNDGWLYFIYIVTFQIPVGMSMTPNETPILNSCTWVSSTNYNISLPNGK